ncbi:unnamed protein product [Prorocentrum cordatum]|uniref:Guanylate cyclase domain-containing protein n=1 Tax=Prorocentrum cordatum TaxID=2364126 RepID=A0ABN9Q2G9_9DINO|nr:unnamed protein product [Polarella glacialis]
MNIFTMLCIMSLLLLFVAVVNRKITMFTRAILQPLRWLVDDMEGLASLELLQNFRDIPAADTRRENRPSEVVDELVQLNKAFGSMQSAIHSWSLYVPPSVVQRLFADRVEAEIGVGAQRVTILFCDISGGVRVRTGFLFEPPGAPPRRAPHTFDPAAARARGRAEAASADGGPQIGAAIRPGALLNATREMNATPGPADFSRAVNWAVAQHPAEIPVRLPDLTAVLAEVAEVIQMHNGTLLEFIGDEVLAVFNAPNPLAHHSLAGALACRDIHRVLDGENMRRGCVSYRTGKEINIRCRCGVHTADILAGNIGSKKRIKYGLLGDGVNLAARLKALNSRYNTRTLATDVLVGSGDRLRRVDFAFRPVDVVAVKGKTEPTTVYELMTTPAIRTKPGLSPCRRNIQRQSKNNPGTMFRLLLPTFRHCSTLLYSFRPKYLPVGGHARPKPRTPESSAIFEACARHQEAFRSYQCQDFARARDAFREVGGALARAGLPRDGPSQLLSQRCERFIGAPPGPEWDGVDHLTRKAF